MAVRVDLTENGLPGQWLEIADLGSFSPRDFQELSQGGAETARTFLSAVVEKWHVVTRKGVELPQPQSPDLDLEAVPTGVTVALQLEVTRQIEDIRNPKVRS